MSVTMTLAIVVAMLEIAYKEFQFPQFKKAQEPIQIRVLLQ